MEEVIYGAKASAAPHGICRRFFRLQTAPRNCSIAFKTSATASSSSSASSPQFRWVKLKRVCAVPRVVLRNARRLSFSRPPSKKLFSVRFQVYSICRTHRPFPMQLDGEPWLQPPCILSIVHKNQVPMLVGSCGRKTSAWNPLRRTPSQT